ncbi:MAG TPA: efflux RND transporter periplasmic adaptor subunit [Phycisphaerae bacterium]|nr:efflux RND transporter periplasmic adaptor subunit [Phycisphaerae bacterium]
MAGVSLRIRKVKQALPRKAWYAVLGGGAAVVVALALVSLRGGGADSPGGGETTRAIRDRFVVTIVESGEVDAKESKDVKCEVEGQSAIVWVIEEGKVVEKGGKLVELDATNLEDRLTSRLSAYRSAKAAYEQAEKQYEIQKSTNESLLSQASLTTKFALLDLKKYLGDALAERLIASEDPVDFANYAHNEALGGEALQKRRDLETGIDLANEELSRAASKVEWTRKLEGKGYVTGSELEADELAYHRREVELGQAKTALDLFLRYDFPKTAEQRFTDWVEAEREYARVKARCESELASAQSKLEAAKDDFEQEERLLAKAREQVEKAVIRAPQSGMVVYYTGSRRWDNVVIEPGAIVRHQQTLIKLPNLEEMIVSAKVHESVVKQVASGAPAYVTIDAHPEKRLTGRVTKVGVMPDRSASWLNPGLKTYLTEITLDETPAGLKPGMSAQVEIQVVDRPGVLQVPVSSVHLDKGYQVVYVRTPRGPEVRRVEVGLSNDRTVEIVSGLKEGEMVHLYKPDGAPELDVPEKAKEPLLPPPFEPEPGEAAEPSADQPKPDGRRVRQRPEGAAAPNANRPKP